MSSSQNILTVRHGSIGYDTPVLNEVDLSLECGKVYLLAGRNGTGKSTLLRTLAGLIPPLSGQVLYKHQAITSFNHKEKAKAIRYLSPRVNIASGLNAREVMELGQLPHGFGKKEQAALHSKIDEISQKFGVSELLERNFSQLSDGERQKVLLCTVWVQNPDIVLLDEPTSFLDYVAKPNVIRALIENVKSDKKCLVIASHDITLMQPLADFVIHIENRQVNMMPAASFKPELD